MPLTSGQISIPCNIKLGDGTAVSTGTTILGPEIPTIIIVAGVRYIVSQIEFDVTNQVYNIIVRAE